MDVSIRAVGADDAAAVLVLDYTVRRVLPDGSALELTHNVVRLQSQEGVDQHATLDNLPQGAMLLTLRTHKADGRVLEPDAIARLEGVAFPDVHIGDAIEFDARLRIDTPGEAAYYRNGGILPYVLRKMLG